MKYIGIGFLTGLVGYVLVAFVSYVLIGKFSSNGHDRGVEASMTSTFQPHLIRLRDNSCLFALNEDIWSAWAVRWLDASAVELNLRKYPGLLACTVVLNASTNQAEAVSGNSSVAGAVSAVTEWIYGLN